MKLSKFIKPHSNHMRVALAGLAGLALAGVFSVYQFAGNNLSPVYAAAQLNQWCAGSSNLCLNAWGGGPLVKVYSPGVTNNNFQVVGSGYDQLEFANTNYCIADNNNNPSDAKAALSSICSDNPDVAGWGVNFTSGFCSGGGVWFHNNHWNGYLGPATSSNGSQFYLNKPTPWCFKILPAA